MGTLKRQTVLKKKFSGWIKMDQIGEKTYRNCTWDVSKDNFAYSVLIFRIVGENEYTPARNILSLLKSGEPTEEKIHQMIDENVFGEYD